MRNQFEYYGLKTPVRRAIQKPFLHKEYLPKASELFAIITELWDKPQREFQHFGQEIAFQYIKNVSLNDMALYEFMVTHKSWWDTVDFIATKLMAYYFKVFPEQQKVYVHKWVHSNNIWLQRCALLFPLKYKDHLDTDLLTTTIYSLLDSKEFFIHKAIGWVLREYSRTNPQWVNTFVKDTPLHSLSRREALRLL